MISAIAFIKRGRHLIPAWPGTIRLRHLNHHRNNKALSKQTNIFYNRFSVLYPLVDLFLKPQKRTLLREINALPYGYLLDVGVGNGGHLPLYRTHRVIGIDTSQNMLKAAARYKKPAINLLHMDGESLEFPDGIFDYIVLSHVIAVAGRPEKLLEEAYRVLKPGGKVFILNHFTPKNRLRYIDQVFQPLAQRFHFRSVFHIDNLAAIQKFNLVKEIGLGWFSYFKLLIYSKA